MEIKRDYIKLKTLCEALGMSYMRVYNNIRIPTLETLTTEEKIKIFVELDKGVEEFKNKIK